MPESNLIMGLWKFGPDIGRGALLAMGKRWATDPAYLQLYVRATGDEELALGFVYLSDGSDKAFSSFFNQYKAELDEGFGDDFTGWDIASTCDVIKGF